MGKMKIMVYEEQYYIVNISETLQKKAMYMGQSLLLIHSGMRHLKKYGWNGQIQWIILIMGKCCLVL
mgnify:CR=1 FL=1